ncbi:hypothetical protein [Terrarubrum flagellatum]|uniref:hypothetical protein n=1 Tax=Terrirubrum flagellatum TaxID=2895980 RepID=UPI0031454B74
MGEIKLREVFAAGIEVEIDLGGSAASLRILVPRKTVAEMAKRIDDAPTLPFSQDGTRLSPPPAPNHIRHAGDVDEAAARFRRGDHQAALEYLERGLSDSFSGLSGLLGDR